MIFFFTREGLSYDVISLKKERGIWCYYHLRKKQQ